jgi:hypothetical protein
MTAEFHGVRVYNNAGAPIGHIHLPERCAGCLLRWALPQPAIHGRRAVGLMRFM